MKEFTIAKIIDKIKKAGKVLNFLSKNRPKIKNEIIGKAIKKPTSPPRKRASISLFLLF